MSIWFNVLSNVLPGLKELIELLIKGGKLFIVVHGTSDRVPYFSFIMNSKLKYIQDIRPKRSPSVHILYHLDYVFKLYRKFLSIF
jgi:hypothetical protein